MGITKENRNTIPGRGPNRITKTVKQGVLDAFIRAQQGDKNLDWFANKYPRDFYAIAAKLIPTEITSTLRRVIHVRVTNGIEQPKIEDADFEEVENPDLDFLE